LYTRVDFVQKINQCKTSILQLMCVQKQRLDNLEDLLQWFSTFPTRGPIPKDIGLGPLGHLLFVNSRVKRNHFGISSGDTGGPRGSH